MINLLDVNYLNITYIVKIDEAKLSNQQIKHFSKIIFSSNAVIITAKFIVNILATARTLEANFSRLISEIITKQIRHVNYGIVENMQIFVICTRDFQ